jgi:hypothetical protein
MPVKVCFIERVHGLYTIGGSSGRELAMHLTFNAKKVKSLITINNNNNN